MTLALFAVRKGTRSGSVAHCSRALDITTKAPSEAAWTRSGASTNPETRRVGPCCAHHTDPRKETAACVCRLSLVACRLSLAAVCLGHQHLALPFAPVLFAIACFAIDTPALVFLLFSKSNLPRCSKTFRFAFISPATTYLPGFGPHNSGPPIVTAIAHNSGIVPLPAGRSLLYLGASVPTLINHTWHLQHCHRLEVRPVR